MNAANSELGRGSRAVNFCITRALITLCGCMLMLSQSARAQIVSNFNTSSEGWTIVSFSNLDTTFSIQATYTLPPNPTYHSTGGNSGGYISSDDPDSGYFTFSAPAAFLGNRSGATGLSYDLYYDGSQAPNYNAPDVILMGGGIRLVWENSPPLDPSTTWSTVSVAFAPSGQWHVNSLTGALATTGNFTTVLGNLTGLYLRGEFYRPGLVELTGIDNVQLSLIPEPSSIALLATGLVPVAALAWRQRRRQGASRV